MQRIGFHHGIFIPMCQSALSSVIFLSLAPLLLYPLFQLPLVLPQVSLLQIAIAVPASPPKDLFLSPMLRFLVSWPTHNYIIEHTYNIHIYIFIDVTLGSTCEYLSFWIWLIFLNLMISSYIHFPANVMTSFFLNGRQPESRNKVKLTYTELLKEGSHV